MAESYRTNPENSPAKSPAPLRESELQDIFSVSPRHIAINTSQVQVNVEEANDQAKEENVKENVSDKEHVWMVKILSTRKQYILIAFQLILYISCCYIAFKNDLMRLDTILPEDYYPSDDIET